MRIFRRKIFNSLYQLLANFVAFLATKLNLKQLERLSTVAKVMIYLSIVVFDWLLNHTLGSDFLWAMSAIGFYMFPIIFIGLRRSLQDTTALWRENAGLTPKNQGIFVNFFSNLFQIMTPAKIKKISKILKKGAIVGFLLLFLMFASYRVSRNIVLMLLIVPAIVEAIGTCLSDVAENREWEIGQEEKRRQAKIAKRKERGY